MSTDPLLDEATRLADDYRNLDEARILRALVERVQQAEAERDAYKTGEGLANGVAERWAKRCMKARAERDAARGKLDTVRALAEDTSESVNNDWGWGYDAAMESVLAILDDKE